MISALDQTAQALRRRGFDAHVFAAPDEAAAFILAGVPQGETVAIGGSMTVKEMDLHTKLRSAGHTVL